VRLDRASEAKEPVQFHDRSIFCTIALAKYLAVPCPDSLMREAERVRGEGLYDPRVFFLRNLGFIEPTAARRITFEETLRFERIHEKVYGEWGFDLIPVERAPVGERVAAILASVQRSTR